MLRREELVKEVESLNIPGEIICAFVAGSHLYGTSSNASDVDIRGVFIPDEEYLIGVKNIEQVEKESPDIVMYSLEKFFKLALKSNPNIIEFFFVPPEISDLSTMFITSDIWRSIVANTSLFLSKKARHTFAGYAFAQLKKIKSHRAWLLNPPDYKPTREEFGLDVTAIPGSTFGWLTREKHYETALSRWKSYQNWKKNRNPARKRLEELYGYDTKHAMHLIRLMFEGEELLTKARITLPSPNIELLCRVREGGWDYETLIENIGDIDVKFDVFYERSVLPHKPNHKAVDMFYQDIIRNILSSKAEHVFFGDFSEGIATDIDKLVQPEYISALSRFEERGKIFDKLSKEANAIALKNLYAGVMPIITSKHKQLSETIDEIRSIVDDVPDGDCFKACEAIQDIEDLLFGGKNERRC